MLVGPKGARGLGRLVVLLAFGQLASARVPVALPVSDPPFFPNHALRIVDGTALETVSADVNCDRGSDLDGDLSAFFRLIQQRTDTGAAGYGTETGPRPRVPVPCDGGCALASTSPAGGSGNGSTARKQAFPSEPML